MNADQMDRLTQCLNDVSVLGRSSNSQPVYSYTMVDGVEYRVEQRGGKSFRVEYQKSSLTSFTKPRWTMLAMTDSPSKVLDIIENHANSR